MRNSLAQIGWAVRLVFSSPWYALTGLVSWFAVLTLFLAISRSSVLVYILFGDQLNASDKLSFVWSVYVNFFAYTSSPVVFTALLFTILAALNITLLVYMAQTMRRRMASRSSLGAAGAMIVSHVLSCGSSLLAPLFSALAGSSAYNDPGRFAVAALFGLVLNMVGLVLIVRSTASVARHIGHMRMEA